MSEYYHTESITNQNLLLFKHFVVIFDLKKYTQFLSIKQIFILFRVRIYKTDKHNSEIKFRAFCIILRYVSLYVCV